MKVEYIYDDHTMQLLEFNEKAQIEELLKANFRVI